MREFGTILGGAGLLIFAYLTYTNYQGATALATGASTAGATIISALQGRSG